MTLEVVKKPPREEGVIEYAGFARGLNTNDSVFSLQPTEAAELLNFKVLRGGSIQTRPPIVAYSTTATSSNSAVKTIANVVIAGTNRELLVDAANKIYYLDATKQATLITGTLAGATEILPYNNAAILLDGSYVKYLDGVSAVKIAYDNGSGTTGYQFNNRTGTRDTTLPLGNGTNTRIAYKFTSQTWDSGYTIPPTTVYAYISKTLSPTGAITATIRLVSNDSVLATKTFYASVASLTGTAEEVYVTFSSSDITTQLSSNTAYYFSLEYSGGDATNYVNVHCTTVASGGTAYHYASATWTNDATYTPCMAVKPGKPPKGKFGAIFNQRPFIAGDSSNPGVMWYGNRSYLDWSTTNLGGYVSAVDDSATSYEIGAICQLYGELYVLGTETQPYICRLTGATPDLYTLPVLFQRSWATHKTIQNVGNDIWFASKDGVDSMSGVNEYGDLRTSTNSGQVENKVTSYWTTATVVSGYYPKEGQFFLTLPGYSRTLVFHTKIAVNEEDGKLIFPISEYEWYRHNLTSSTYKWVDNSGEWYLQAAAGGTPGLLAKPDFITINGKQAIEGTAGSLNDHEWDWAQDPTSTYNTVYVKDATGDPDTSGVDIQSVFAPQCYYQSGQNFLMGGSDGFVYKVDESEYKDLTTNPIRFDLRGRYTDSAFGKIIIDAYKLICTGTMGGQITFNLYKDDSLSSSYFTQDLSLSLDDRLTVNDMTGDVADAYYTVNPEGASTFRRMQLLCRSFQPQIKDILLSGKPVIIRGLIFKFRKADM